MSENRQSGPKRSLDAKDVLSGEDAAIKTLAPYMYIYQAGLGPKNRPAGIFLLLGPTAASKTKTVEGIAELLHGSAQKIVRVDCGDRQMDRQGTLHTLTQKQLSEAASEGWDLALVLIEQIDKATRSMAKLLFGILEKGILQLRDDTVVKFEKSLIFLTGNFDVDIQSRSPTDLSDEIESIALAALEKKFSREFVYRIDAVVPCQPIDPEPVIGSGLGRLKQNVNSHVESRDLVVDQ